jgi:hypothetical protein
VSLRRILVLLVLVAALGTYLWVYELPQAEKEGKKEKLLAVDAATVTGVTLAYPDRRIELRKTDGGWRVAAPVDAPADESAVKSLLTTVIDAEVQRSLDELPQDLGSFGLSPPSATVTLTVAGETQPPPVKVGKNTAIGGKTYVRRGDEPKLLLTASTLQFGVSKQVKDLRDKQLLTFEDDDVTRVEIRPAGGDPTTLVRKADAGKDGAWTVEPGGRPADPTEVRSYLSSLRATRAVDFPDDAPSDLAKYGLEAPRLTVTLATGTDGAAMQTLLLGSETTQGTQKQVYAKRADRATVYALGDWSFRTLSKDARQFRDKTVLGFDVGRLGRLALERETGTGVTLVRGDDGSWRLDGDDAAKTPKTDAVRRFVDDVRELRGSEIAAEPADDLATYGLDAPDLRIVVTDKDGQAVGTILASKHAGKHYAMRAGSETVFEVRDYMFARLDKQASDFVEAPKAAGPTTTLAPGADPVPPDDDADLELGEDDEDAEDLE